MDENSGWIKLHRCLIDKAIWTCSTPEHCKILINLLIMANHEVKEWIWQGEKFKANSGQFVTSLESIRKKCGKGITIQNIRSALEKFKKLEFLTYESTKTGRLITIVNWQAYQSINEYSNKDSNKEPTNDQQTGNKEPTTNKNDKNNKNVRSNIYTPEFEKFYSEYPRSENKSQTFINWKSKLKNGLTVDLIMKAVENYKIKCEDEEKEKRYCFNSSNFLGKANYVNDYLPKNFDPSKIKSKGGTSYGADKKFTGTNETKNYTSGKYGNFFKRDIESGS